MSGSFKEPRNSDKWKNMKLIMIRTGLTAVTELLLEPAIFCNPLDFQI